MRRVSLESRRQSLDSQLSVAVADLGSRKSGMPMGGGNGGGGNGGGVADGTEKSRGRELRRTGIFGHALSARRSSSTSQDSQISGQVT